jgi:hypothetical protein
MVPRGGEGGERKCSVLLLRWSVVNYLLQEWPYSYALTVMQTHACLTFGSSSRKARHRTHADR